MLSILRKPSAWIPIVIPFAFLVYLTIYISLFGIVYHEDEDFVAHIFQLWLATEPFLVGYFALKWLPRAPKPAFVIIILQVAAAFAACFPVFYFSL